MIELVNWISPLNFMSLKSFINVTCLVPSDVLLSMGFSFLWFAVTRSKPFINADIVKCRNWRSFDPPRTRLALTYLYIDGIGPIREGEPFRLHSTTLDNWKRLSRENKTFFHITLFYWPEHNRRQTLTDPNIKYWTLTCVTCIVL